MGIRPKPSISGPVFTLFSPRVDMNDEQKCDFREAIRDKSPVETDPEVLATALSNIGTLSPRLRKVYDDSAALLRAQATEIEALRKDAARYRWLRDNPWPSFLRSIVVTQSNAAWDTAIDASMKAQT